MTHRLPSWLLAVLLAHAPRRAHGLDRRAAPWSAPVGRRRTPRNRGRTGRRASGLACPSTAPTCPPSGWRSTWTGRPTRSARAAAGGSSPGASSSRPADAEALFFATAEGARAVLEREAGPERTPGPGDEAAVSAQAVYFRRGTALVRVFLDPGASAPEGGLVARAREIDRALQARGPL